MSYRTDGPVAVITLNRPEAANAQSFEFLDELDAAWTTAERDPDVRVILLNANGKHFSAGHDLRSDTVPETLAEMYANEADRYIGYSLKWRNSTKPTIAAVQGMCIAAGLMLCWPCDIIIAADNAQFSDPVVNMGIGGVEYHGHTWELGARKAKELLFTGDRISATTAERLGMVNRVVPLETLFDESMALAQRIAQKDPWALRQAKRAVNQTLDIQGFQTALQSVFDIHATGHGHWFSAVNFPALAGLEQMKAAQSKEVS
ncbi:enoyl-CoA hydratase [Nocardia nova]|uniref:Enoyl-CoA hydratase n=1 Tax=Nocardia nova TaxID=37330 RepID=A0A2S6AWC5_9NOCA|nr:enoyl-CoA hydratase [Nocardia nova]PPJ33753.1 enoyl-CoA hydratase [Nocardia nova]PPJ39546.1 enoyl-CoA hydratase [Nocardia nova]